jgi:hypothetical protein
MVDLAHVAAVRADDFHVFADLGSLDHDRLLVLTGRR